MSDQLRLELGQGEALRDAGAKAVLDRNAAWAAKADRCMKLMAVCGYDFTAEDIVAEIGLPPHPNAMGGVFLRASRKGLIVPVGVKRATRDARHASMLRIWRGR